MSPDVPMIDSISVAPVSPKRSRTWEGELFYGKIPKSLGMIRLLIPQSSFRMERLPTFSGPSICLSKMLSAHCITTKMFPKTPLPGAKHECLLVEFTERESQSLLVDMFRRMDSAGMVFEETCTLLFFFRPNERLRNLFNSDASTAPITVAVLPPMHVMDLESNVSNADKVYTLTTT
jgi:hypothetical protein